MRLAWVLVVFAACSPSIEGTGNGDCPQPEDGADVEGTACNASETCFVENTFSSCSSGYYACEGGAWHRVRGLDAAEGASCADSPLTSCSIEGSPGCNTPPTSGGCSCGDDGVWHCFCACYGPQTTCAMSCPATSTTADGAACSPAGYQCQYPDATCTCSNAGGELAFSCS
jgi:hypothetical protein